MRSIHSTIGLQMWFKFAIYSFANSSLTLPACAPAQVNVDFLEGEDGARSTSNSAADLGIFEILFDPVEVGHLLARCAARARLPSLSAPPPCLCAAPLCSPSLCFSTLN